MGRMRVADLGNHCQPVRGFRPWPEVISGCRPRSPALGVPTVLLQEPPRPAAGIRANRRGSRHGCGPTGQAEKVLGGAAPGQGDQVADQLPGQGMGVDLLGGMALGLQ